VEQQLYIGKSIVQAIEDVAGDDTDGDGFTNGDELATYRTLPGYSCANYSIAQDPPADFQSLITPGVPSCLEPKDIKLDPTVISFVTTIGDTSTATLQLINNGSDFPIEVTDVSLLPDAPPSLTIDVPPLPLSIPVGQSVPVPVHGAGRFPRRQVHRHDRHARLPLRAGRTRTASARPPFRSGRTWSTPSSAPTDANAASRSWRTVLPPVDAKKLVHPPPYVVPDLAHPLTGLALGVLQRPVLAFEAGRVRTVLAAPHRDEERRPPSELLGKTGRAAGREVEPHLPHDLDDLGMDTHARFRAGRECARLRWVGGCIEERRSHL
jgi:hypothetical protein